MGYIIIETTFDNKKEAEKVAKRLIESKLAACIHLSKVESYFRWKNKLEQTKEYKLKIKTTNKNYMKVEKLIKQNHKYKVPEIISIKIKRGSRNYLNWMKEVLN